MFRYRRHVAFLRQAWKEVCQQYGTFDRLIGYIIVWVLLLPFFATVVNFREMISQIIPFTWDPWLQETSRSLHWGFYPWTLLQPLLGYPMITVSLDFCYMLWFPILLLFLLGFALSVRRGLRLQYILSFMLVWIILGTICATIFSSAGPCFYSFVEQPDNPYTSLFTYLDSVHQQYFLWSRYEQLRMWQAYTQGAPFGGITAMPSLHVAGATLFALGAWALNLRLGIVFIGYAVMIQVGSVHLGWHYALDGYISSIATWLIWRLVGWALSVTEWISLDEGNPLVSTTSPTVQHSQASTHLT